jgi:AcrR family transcriptional regulator
MKKRGRPCKTGAEGELSAKEKILETALKLFYQHGINSVGVDRIIAEAEVAKMTFFKHFPTKRDLILAFLKLRDERYMQLIEAQVNKTTSDPQKKLQASIDAMAFWFRMSDFRGCAFINTTAEVGPGEKEEKTICISHKQRLAQFLAGLAMEGGFHDPEKLAEQLVIVIDGATVRAQMEGPENAIRLLNELSSMLMDFHRK